MLGEKINFMKKISVFCSTTLLVCLVIACASNLPASTTNSGSTGGSGNNSASANSSVGKAKFSCVVDGKPVSGGQISSYQGPEGYQSNEAHIVDVDQGKELLFYLSDPETSTSQGVHSLRFAVPDKTGSSSFGPDEDSWGIEVDILVNDKHTARYNSDSFTINVTNLSATRVSGTFSGKFTLNGNITDTDKKAIEVTDGKFDIPMKN
jgi:hypothetical protein